MLVAEVVSNWEEGVNKLQGSHLVLCALILKHYEMVHFHSCQVKADVF